MDSGQDAIEAFQKALLQAQGDSESNHIQNDILDGDLDSHIVFSGSVSSVTSNSNQSNSLSRFKKKAPLPSWALFMMGLIVLPIATGVISAVLVESGNISNEYWANYGLNDGQVTIQDETYNVHEFDLGWRFDAEYPSEGYWDLVVEGIVGNNGGYSDATINGDGDGPHTRFDSFEIDGDTWYKMDMNHCSLGLDRCGNIFIKFDGNTVDVAGESMEAPIYVGYLSEAFEGTGAVTEFLGFVIWPISIIGGIIWGYKTDRKPFAYGVMTAGCLTLLPFVGLFLLLILFGF